MKYPLILFVGLFASQLSKAQQMLTLEDVVAAVLKNNYDILLSRNDSASYAIDRSYAYAAFLPQLNATGNAVWNTNNQELKFQKRDGSGGDSSVTRNAVRNVNLTYGVNLNWTLFDGFKMFATRARVIESEKMGTYMLKIQVVNTVANVINNYYNIVRTKQQLRAIEEQIGLNEERVKLADRKLSVGLGSKPELLQARVDLNANKALRLQQLTQIAQLRDQLNQLIGFKVGSVYEVSDSIPINTNLQYGEFQQQFENTNPSILLAKKNIDIARLVVKERRGDLFPVLQFNSAYNFARTDNSVVVNLNQPFFNQNRGLNYGLGLNVPIFNGFNARRLIKQAQLDVDYNQINLEKQRSLVDAGISNAFKAYELQKSLLALEEENIVLAKENVDIAFARFKQGVSPFLELREAQQSLLDAESRLIAARYNTKVAETELLRLKGDLVR